MVVSAENAEHYLWGEGHDGWRLLPGEDLSVIEERVPAGGAEQMHFHHRARQFFYVLEGEGIMIYTDREVRLGPGQGLEIPPGVKHQFRNRSGRDVRFLVISAPSTREDRVNI